MIRGGLTRTFWRHPALCSSLGLFTLVAVAAASEWWDYPEKIALIEVKGDVRELAVSKSARLPDDFVPDDLALIAPEVMRTNKPVEVRRELLEPLKALHLAAERDGIDLVILSGYRSFARQKEVYQFWVDREGGDKAAADRYSARAGHSEHQLGTVLDFSSREINDAIGTKFETTKAAGWLRENAGKYGFRLSYAKGRESETGYQWESWHWRWWPEKS